ncbi:MAG TPA: 4-hydroxy-tetrahydrodipicolinate reductase [Steroidobacteraceae bacterium]|nr:4-hydroxy-tetrahydrodipicolinate reductase [Steroidobacteraceae bacterium]
MSGIAIFGVTGRMGQALIRALREQDAAQPLRLAGAVASPSSVRLGSDAAADGLPTGVMVTAEADAALRHAAVAVDFSLPQCVADNARACVTARVPLLVGATGFDGATRDVLHGAAALIPVLIAPNTSIGVNLVARLVKLTTRALGPAYDVEISEAHHRAKRDAPSGTALALGEVVAAERGTTLAEVAVFDRHGSSGPRKTGDIGFAVLRAGDIVGEHTVTFAVAGERVEITHRATDRVTFAHGALRAAAWLRGRAPGLYAMDDVLDFDQP